MKTKVVVFQDNYARILINPMDSDVEALLSSDLPVLINPDLRFVKGLSPEYWKYDSDSKMIVAMDEDEKKIRVEDKELGQQFGPIFIKQDGFKEIIKTVEVVKEVEKIVNVEVIKEVQVIKEVEVIKTVELIKEVPVIVEKIVNISVPTIETVYVDRIKEVEVIKEVAVPVNKEVTKLVFQKVIPKSIIALLVIESVIIGAGLLIKLLG